MNRKLFVLLCTFQAILFGCETSENQNIVSVQNGKNHFSADSIIDYAHVSPFDKDSLVHVVLEIPAGTIDKWELNKSNGQLEWEIENGKPRKVNYLGYPGNYGFIPQTLLSKEQGGDGDPLDILVLGPSAPRGSIVKCKIIGVLYLLDRGERDDKLIAISIDSPLGEVNNIDELEYSYHGVLEIVKLWFENYKGHDLIKSPGYGNKTTAIDILKDAIEQYKIH